MANIIGVVTINETDLIEVDADPSAGGGTASAISSLALFSTGSLGRMFLKTGAANTAWTEITAGTGTTLKTKSGTVTAGTFAGNPKKATVTFSTAFANANYSIQITGTDNRSFSWESKAAASFVINANANTALTGNVDWIAIATGETT